MKFLVMMSVRREILAQPEEARRMLEWADRYEKRMGELVDGVRVLWAYDAVACPATVMLIEADDAAALHRCLAPIAYQHEKPMVTPVMEHRELMQMELEVYEKMAK
jgi:hypothetical protein